MDPILCPHRVLCVSCVDGHESLGRRETLDDLGAVAVTVGDVPAGGGAGLPYVPAGGRSRVTAELQEGGAVTAELQEGGAGYS